MFVEEIAIRLADQEVAIIGRSIKWGGMAVLPEDVDDSGFITLTETGGTGSAKTHNDTATARPTMQVAATAATYGQARALAAAAFAALGGENGLYNLTLSGVFYLSIVARQGLTDIGLDNIGRPRVVFNIDAEKAPS